MTGFRNALLGAAGAATGGYSVDNSIVLDDGSSQYLQRTPSSAASERIGTFSMWVKRGVLGTNQMLFTNERDDSAGTQGVLEFQTDDQLRWKTESTIGANIMVRETTQVFRDPHAWYHIMVTWDSNQTDDTCASVWINGEQVTDFVTKTNFSSAQDLGWPSTTKPMTIGAAYSGTNYSDVYLSQFVYLDGTASSNATDFGEYDTNGVWRPIDIANAGLTFGNNGFYLPFTDSGQLGADSSTGNQTSITLSGEWTGDTSDFTTLNTDIVPALGQTGAIKSVDTFTGDFAIEFEWQGGANPAYLGVYEIDEDGSFSQTSADGGMGSMTDSFYLFFTSGNAVNAVNGSSTEASSIFTAAAGEVVKFQRSGSTFTVYEDGVLRHTFTATSANEVRIVVGQNSSSMDWRDFRWVSGGTITGNPFTPSGSPTQSSDTPTNVCCNFSPLIVSDLSFTLSEGNRKVVVSNDSAVRGSMAIPTSGKYYFEVECVNDNTFGLVGFMRSDKVYDKITSGRASQTAGLGGYDWDDSGGLFRRETTTAYTGSTWTTGDILGFYIDYDNDAIWASKNGTLENGASQSEVEAGTTTNAIWTGTLATDGSVVPYVGCNGGSNMTFKINCGQEPFNTSLYAGYRDLSSTSFYTNAAPAIEDGTAYFQATLYTGDGVAIGSGGQEVNQSENSTFQPDFVWIKARSSAENHNLADAVRGATKILRSNLANAEDTQAESIASFDADGFTVGDYSNVNTSSVTHVAWQWNGDGTSGSTNSDGSITSTVNVNDTAGFSIGTYTGNGTGGATVGHGLGKPSFIIVKNRDQADGWSIYHPTTTATDELRFNTAAASANSAIWNNTEPTSTVFTVGTSHSTNATGENYVFYAWQSIPGYSAFGSYAASSGNPLIFLDFTPAFAIFKRIDSTGEWPMFDNARDPYYDADSSRLYADTAAAENTGTDRVQFGSNFIKITAAYTSADPNVGGTYIYAAFAENPFAGSSPATAR